MAEGDGLLGLLMPSGGGFAVLEDSRMTMVGVGEGSKASMLEAARYLGLPEQSQQ